MVCRVQYQLGPLMTIFGEGISSCQMKGGDLKFGGSKCQKQKRSQSWYTKNNLQKNLNWMNITYFGVKFDVWGQRHLGHINFSPPDIIWILPGKINRLLLKSWPCEITGDEIRIWHYLFLANKSAKHNQISFWWNNLNLDKAYLHDR